MVVFGRKGKCRFRCKCRVWPEANTTSEANTTARSYEDFEPSSKWKRADGLHILEIHLPGFKEQLRVQVDNHGNMKISGERQIEENRWSRFYKKFLAPENSNTAEITAKFFRDIGVLQIKLPTKAEADQPTMTETPKSPKTQIEENVGEKKSEQVTGAIATAASSSKRALIGLAFRLNVQKRFVVGAVVSLIVAVVLGVYGVSKLRSSVGDGEN